MYPFGRLTQRTLCQTDPNRPLLVQVQGDHTVFDSKLRRVRLYYLIDLEGYSPEECFWEFAAHVHALDLVKRFHQDHSDKPGQVLTWRKGAVNVRNHGLESGSSEPGITDLPTMPLAREHCGK